jgi:cysteine desulfurase
MAPAAQAALLRCQAEAWANPSSLHGFGLAAAEELERQRQSAWPPVLGCDAGRVVFTSGGTEAIHLALLGTCSGVASGARLVTTAVEHPATLAAAEQRRRARAGRCCSSRWIAGAWWTPIS